MFSFIHAKSASRRGTNEIISTTHSATSNFIFSSSINVNLLSKGLVLISGPLGSFHVDMQNAYISHTSNSIQYHTHLITRKLFPRIQQGLTLGHSVRILQSGVWTVMKFDRPSNTVTFQLGFSHPTQIVLPSTVLFKSKREGQSRIINLISPDFETVKSTAAKLVRLSPADPYKLSGLRYATTLPPTLKPGKKK